jgi:hypothetical protein
MTVTLSQMAEELADSMTASVSAPGTYNVSPQGSYSLGGNANTTITSGGFAFANTAITNNGVATGSLGPYTVTSGTGITQPWFSNSITPKIKLDGEGADIEVNGWSLMDAIQKIEERLNILHPNEKLEAEWEELRALGEQYRKLEQHIKDKQATWERLKAMPPLEID